MNTRAFCHAVLLALLASSTTFAHAHRAWLLPSATTFSGKEPWVTVDAAISTDIFYADHNPMRLDGLSITAPDGSRVAPDNIATARFRSTFDVKLTQPGTYKLAVVSETTAASYKLNGEVKRWRGAADAMAKEIPAGAQDVKLTRLQTRNEVFLTSGKPSDSVLAISGAGLELRPVTHPNDLTAGSPASFVLMLDGKPASGIEVLVIPGGVRYRDRLDEIKAVTDAAGRFSIRWPAAGMYWLNATQGAMAPMDAGAAGNPGAPARRASYSATFEVLPQ
jgi:uncharacterized GH25 family protein